MSYIEREKALKVIADIMSDCKVSHKHRALNRNIKQIPTADVVVRCKDCKFNVANMQIDENDVTDYSGEDIVCSYFMTDGLEPNDYCSHGERRENGKS